jgi:hypothetical protein
VGNKGAHGPQVFKAAPKMTLREDKAEVNMFWWSNLWMSMSVSEYDRMQYFV